MKQTVDIPCEMARSRRIKAERARDIYAAVVSLLTKDRRYKDANLTAVAVAAELHVNKRYLAEAVALCAGCNYAGLVNRLRLREVQRMMASVHYDRLTVEDLGLLAGFGTRQSLYKACASECGCTPRRLRLELRRQREQPPEPNP